MISSCATEWLFRPDGGNENGERLTDGSTFPARQRQTLRDRKRSLEAVDLQNAFAGLHHHDGAAVRRELEFMEFQIV